MHACARLKRWCWQCGRRAQMLSTSPSPWTPQRAGYPRSRLTASHRFLTALTSRDLTTCRPSVCASSCLFKPLGSHNLRSKHSQSKPPRYIRILPLCHHQLQQCR